MPRRRPRVCFPCSGRRCRPTAPPARRPGPPRARCHSSFRSTAFSRVSPSPKRCQAKAGSGWGKGSWPGSLYGLLDCLWEPSRWGDSLSRPPGPRASASISLQIQHPRLNNGFSPGSLGAGWLGLLGDEMWSSWVAPNTQRWRGAGSSEKQPGVYWAQLPGGSPKAKSWLTPEGLRGRPNLQIRGQPLGQVEALPQTAEWILGTPRGYCSSCQSWQVEQLK